MAWDWGIDAYRTVCIPSLMQPDNIPWLLRNGFDVRFTFYTFKRDEQRLMNVLRGAFEGVAPGPGTLHVGIAAPDLSAQESFMLKRAAFLQECQVAMEAGAPVLVTGADAFYGNGSIRNVCTYGMKPGIAIAVLSTRVKQEPFLRLLDEYRSAFGNEPVSNARLVDMALRTEIDAAVNSNVDVERNASFRTGTSVRDVSDDIQVRIFHLPSPILVWPLETDLRYLDGWCHGVYESVDHLWPEKLVAERRWRVMASSDLFFLAELNSAETMTRHEYPIEENRLYNESFEFETTATLTSEMIVATFRREPYLSALPRRNGA